VRELAHALADRLDAVEAVKLDHVDASLQVGLLEDASPRRG